jgi:hypothetical protein
MFDVMCGGGIGLDTSVSVIVGVWFGYFIWFAVGFSGYVRVCFVGFAVWTVGRCIIAML